MRIVSIKTSYTAKFKVHLNLPAKTSAFTVQSTTSPVLPQNDSCNCGGQDPQSSQQALPGGLPVECSQDEGPAQWVVGKGHVAHPSQHPHGQLQHKQLVWGHRRESKRRFRPLSSTILMSTLHSEKAKTVLHSLNTPLCKIC